MAGLLKINNPAYDSLKVLIAPLDWGLGHATRCIPIIKELLNQRCEVIVAASGPQRALLQGEFASLTFVELPRYGLRYGKNRALTVLRIIGSIPKILIGVKLEKAWLKRFVGTEGPDLIISDNRYGLAMPGVFCVFMTHQLLIKTPFGPYADRLLQRLNYRFIRRFSRCWVPDIAGDEALAGELSNPVQMPAIPVRYISWLSRMQRPVAEMSIRESAATRERARESTGTYEGAGLGDGAGVLVLLSGPEPQRTLLEKRILRQAADCPDRIVLVRGLPGGGPVVKDAPGCVVVYDHLPAAALEQEMSRAMLVVARSGYSTIMDLVRLDKRALLVPTPGQTEQEYLGRYLAAKGWAACVRQKDFLLAEALRIAAAGTSAAAGTMAATGVNWPPEDAAGDALCKEIAAVLVQARAARSGPMA